MPAGELEPGDRVGSSGVGLELAAVRAKYTPIRVYNLEVEGSHTYFVGEQELWVHNGGGSGKIRCAEAAVEVGEAAAKGGGKATRAGHNGVHGPVQQTTRTTRSGEVGVRHTYPDGSVKDITPNRVKEFVPNNHPKAPDGALQRVKFDDALPGTKGYKRAPTAEELGEL